MKSRVKLDSYEVVRKYRWPHPVLEVECRTVDDHEVLSPHIQQVTNRLRFIVAVDPNSAGLAAPQVGFDLRICALRTPDKVEVFINPEITSMTDEQIEALEGCFSLPGKRVSIKRANGVTLEGLNQKGLPVRRELVGLYARAAQHELDHLQGKLILEYGEAEAWV